MNEIKNLEQEDVVYVHSAFGKRIKILRIGWENIVFKHPELEGKLSLVIETLERPSAVTASKISLGVHLYHRPIDGKYVCVICRHYNGDGFLITAYITNRIKGTLIV